MRLAILTSRIRVEEKLLIEALRQRAIAFDIIDDGELLLDLAHPDQRWRDYDAVLCRSLSQSRGLAVLHVLEHWGIPVHNSAAVTATCNDKLLTTLALLHADIPTPRTLLAFDPQTTIRGIEVLGYPVVLKPTNGSWGRLLARINDRDAAEAVLVRPSALAERAFPAVTDQEGERLVGVGGRRARRRGRGGERCEQRAQQAESRVSQQWRHHFCSLVLVAGR